METKYYSGAATETLLRNVKVNLPLYKNPDLLWAAKFLTEDAMISPVYNPLKRFVSDIDFSFVFNTKGKDESICDSKNAIMVHKVLRGLNRKDASDPNFWTCLCHENPACYEYAYKRWLKGVPEEDKQIRIIESHYFVGKNADSASLDTQLRQKNVLSRLFWSAAVTYNEQFSDPYELTYVLLDTKMVHNNFALSPSFKSPNRCTGFLLAIKEILKEKRLVGSEFSWVVSMAIRELNNVARSRQLNFLSVEENRDLMLELFETAKVEYPKESAEKRKIENARNGIFEFDDFDEEDD